MDSLELVANLDFVSLAFEFVAGSLLRTSPCEMHCALHVALTLFYLILPGADPASTFYGASDRLLKCLEGPLSYCVLMLCFKLLFVSITCY